MSELFKRRLLVAAPRALTVLFQTYKIQWICSRKLRKVIIFSKRGFYSYKVGLFFFFFFKEVSFTFKETVKFQHSPIVTTF